MKILIICFEFEKIDYYKKNGFLLLKGVLSTKELEELSREYDQLFERKKQENAKLEAMWKGDWSQSGTSKNNTSVLSIHNLQQHSAVFTKLLLNDKMMASVKENEITVSYVIDKSY